MTDYPERMCDQHLDPEGPKKELYILCSLWVIIQRDLRRRGLAKSGKVRNRLRVIYPVDTLEELENYTIGKCEYYFINNNKKSQQNSYTVI